MVAQCHCEESRHPPKLVVLTGGPGAGKTAVLELIKQNFCEHVVVLAEAASVVFGGGFPRKESVAARRASQRAIFHVQRELEAMVIEERHAAVVLCDRGTLDGLAYWPDDPSMLWTAVGSTAEQELERYEMVIHLRTPPADGGYDHKNPLRTESAKDASRIDSAILDAWARHPRRVIIDNHPEFLSKAAAAVDKIRAEVPACCRAHTIPEIEGR